MLQRLFRILILPKNLPQKIQRCQPDAAIFFSGVNISNYSAGILSSFRRNMRLFITFHAFSATAPLTSTETHRQRVPPSQLYPINSEKQNGGNTP